MTCRSIAVGRVRGVLAMRLTHTGTRSRSRSAYEYVWMYEYVLVYKPYMSRQLQGIVVQ